MSRLFMAVRICVAIYAHYEGLLYLADCVSCDFSWIPVEGDKIF